MTYEEFLLTAQTGDVLATCSNTFVRVLTGESFSHVAMVLKNKDNLFVAEQVETHGYRIVTLEEWIKGKAQFTFAQAPKDIRGSLEVFRAAYTYPEKISSHYGWLTLFVVWLSQLTGIKFPKYHDVCSTFIARMWAAERVIFMGNPDPGSIVRACEPRYTVNLSKRG